MNGEDDNDVPAVTGFFSKRAKFAPKVSAAQLQAASDLLDFIQEEKNKFSSNEDVEFLSVKRKGKSKRKVPAKEKSLDPEEILLEDKVEDAASSIDIITDTEVKPSAAAKRRLKKLQAEHNKELTNIKAANEKALSALNSSDICEVEETDIENHDKISVLTISYLSDVSRLKCHENEKFSTIFPKVADLFKLKASEFLLCLREKNIKVSDTPSSLNIVDTDILECIPYKAEGSSEVAYDADTLKIFFQSSNSKEKSEMPVHKLEKMQDVMEKYSKTQNIPLEQLVFEFDGEKISGTETAEDMDMESGNTIDVRVLVSTPEKQTNKSSERRRTRNSPGRKQTSKAAQNQQTRKSPRRKNKTNG